MNNLIDKKYRIIIDVVDTLDVSNATEMVQGRFVKSVKTVKANYQEVYQSSRLISANGERREDIIGSGFIDDFLKNVFLLTADLPKEKCYLSTDQILRDKIYDQITAERKRQDEKFGEQNHNPAEWMAILTEEVGEVSKEAVDFHFKLPIKVPHLQGKRQPTESDQHARLLRYEEELIQTAAVCVQMIESLHRNNLPKHDLNAIKTPEHE